MTGLLITDRASAAPRPTTDVDVITEAYSYGEYEALSARLRGLGLTEDIRQGAPTCRWRQGNSTIDVMPIDERVLGFANRWYRPAMDSAHETELAGLVLRLITPVYFVATKLEAFHGRGNGDHLASHDLEDVIAVVNGREELGAELRGAPEDVRAYIQDEFANLHTTQTSTTPCPDSCRGMRLVSRFCGSALCLPLLALEPDATESGCRFGSSGSGGVRSALLPDADTAACRRSTMRATASVRSSRVTLRRTRPTASETSSGVRFGSTFEEARRRGVFPVWRARNSTRGTSALARPSSSQSSRTPRSA